MSAALPSSAEVEQAVLACCLMHPSEAMPRVMRGLGDTPEAFYLPQHRAIYTRMLDQFYVEGSFDLVTLNTSIAAEVDGGAATLATIASDVPTLGMLGKYLSILSEQSTKRELIAKLELAHNLAYDPQSKAADVTAIIDEITAGVSKTEGELRPVHESLSDTLDSIEDAMRARLEGRPFTGLSTGFRDVDAILSGLSGGTMHIVAGRPGMGKTALKMNIAEHVAYNLKQNVAVFSLEMTTVSLLRRLLSSRGAIEQSSMSKGTLSKLEFQKLAAAAEEIKKAGTMFVDPTPAITINELRSRARRANNKHGIDLVVVDYLQLVRSNSSQAKYSRIAELGEVSMGLKQLAKEIDAPVIAGAQLNREVDGRSSKKPRISDIRESGSLEQDADSVALLYRSEYYGEESGEDEAEEGAAVLSIAKNRNGPTGEVPLRFEGEFTRFKDASYENDGFN